MLELKNKICTMKVGFNFYSRDLPWIIMEHIKMTNSFECMFAGLTMDSFALTALFIATPLVANA